jgi:UDP-3-O-[3-hydroxymyristoyl] glucosamine N-acyltransferase
METVPAITASELAARLGLRLRGNGNRQIAAAAALDDAGPDDLTFISSPKYFEAGLDSAAGCFIASTDFPAASDRTVIESAQPRAHFAQALALLYPAAPLHAGIHPTAVIHPSVSIDPTTEIGPFVTIGSGAVIGARVRVGASTAIGSDSAIGDDSLLHASVSIYGRVRIGKRALIHSGAVIGADGFGFELSGAAYRKVPQVGRVEIGDDVEIGANSCIDRAALGTTVIGDGTKLDNMVHIGHNCRIGKHVLIVAQTGLAGGVSVGDYAVIGGQVGVGDKARIESKAVIGSGAGILSSKIVHAGEPVWGTPARPLRHYLRQLATLSRLAKRRSAPEA